MIINTKLIVPPTRIRNRPATRRTRRVAKPMKREIRRSINIWNFKSREAFSLAVSAEIWRNGLKSVRMSEFMEKKSIMLERKDFVF